MQSLPINSANTTWWYGNDHNSGTIDPKDSLTWMSTVPITTTAGIGVAVSGILNWPITTTVGMGIINTNAINKIGGISMSARMSSFMTVKYTLSYENFKRAYHKFDGYVFLMENSIDGTIQYLSVNTIMALIYRFYGDNERLPFPLADNELTIWYRMPHGPYDTPHVFEVEEDELKLHYKVLSES